MFNHVSVILLVNILVYFYCLQALPNRKEALIVSPWPLTSLPRNLTAIKRFENLQALVSVILVFYFVSVFIDNLE